MLNLTVPLLSGWRRIRRRPPGRQQEEPTQRQLDDARRTAVQNAGRHGDMVAARAAADSTRSQIRANEIALEGVEREAIVAAAPRSTC